jgi:hypothetical protein
VTVSMKGSDAMKSHVSLSTFRKDVLLLFVWLRRLQERDLPFKNDVALDIVNHGLKSRSCSTPS